VTVRTAFVCFAERHKIRRLKFEIRVQMERPDMVNFQLFRATTQGARGMQCEVLFADGRPVTGARGAERVFPLGSIDKVFDDRHKKSPPKWAEKS